MSEFLGPSGLSLTAPFKPGRGFAFPEEQFAEKEASDSRLRATSCAPWGPRGLERCGKVVLTEASRKPTGRKCTNEGNWQEVGEPGRDAGDLDRKARWREGLWRGGCAGSEQGEAAGLHGSVLPHYVARYRGRGGRRRRGALTGAVTGDTMKSLGRGEPRRAGHTKKSRFAEGLGTLEKDSRTFDEFRERRS